MSENTATNEQEYGPLGPGHTPQKDPMAGVRGVMAGTLIMEVITFLLVLPVILRVDGGAHFTTFNIVYVAVLSIAMLVMAFMQRKSWALPANIVLQVLAVAGFFVHMSMGIMGLIYAAVWAYILYLRKNMKERMRRGLLPTQHS